MGVQTFVFVSQFAADVARDLRRTPKQLNAQYLYDALGSSLFDAICRLPWYRITRCEEQLLSRHAEEIAAMVLEDRAHAMIVELGVGSGEKLTTLIEALPLTSMAHVHLIDISPAALEATAARLAQFPHVSVVRHEGTYEEGLHEIGRDTTSGTKLVLFLGSNIGNFDAPDAEALLRRIRRTLAPHDRLLLGADLVKPAADLILAYDDPLGVTAAFNRNLLVRINRELGGDFDLTAFAHRAIWNEREHRVEMHLVCRTPQDVSIPAADLRVHFEPGESIWTESSYKYTERAIVEMGADAGFAASRQWLDADARFAVTLFEAI